MRGGMGSRNAEAHPSIAPGPLIAELRRLLAATPRAQDDDEVAESDVAIAVQICRTRRARPPTVEHEEQVREADVAVAVEVGRTIADRRLAVTREARRIRRSTDPPPPLIGPTPWVPLSARSVWTR